MRSFSQLKGARMEGIQAFLLSMKRESQNQYIYGKSHKEYKKPTTYHQEIYVIYNIEYFFLFSSNWPPCKVGQININIISHESKKSGWQLGRLDDFFCRRGSYFGKTHLQWFLWKWLLIDFEIVPWKSGYNPGNGKKCRFELSKFQEMSGTFKQIAIKGFDEFALAMGMLRLSPFTFPNLKH